MYCDKCGNGLPSPEELDTFELLGFIAVTQYGIQCKSCGVENHHYSIEGVIDELANRIDRGIK